eukprot:jgi/Psemu1/286861/fgenesh1_pg.158_\
MSAFTFNVFSFLALQLILLSTTVEGFQTAHRVSVLSQSLESWSTTARGNTRVFNSKNEDGGNDDGDQDQDSWKSPLPLSSPLSQQLEQGTFNPLAYQGKSKTNRPSGNAQAQVSLRSLRMTSLTDDLLNGLGNQAAVRAILEENRDFLLEPLESEDSVAGSGSIYTPGMTRSERYETYRKSVNKRLESSKNAKATAVLTAMRDFVLEFENKEPL